ncbi:Endonuclease/exonuclease/phosphatase [Trema orientale]|uniref:Endonuclease/exonuclease/phosphatase n=1 Tax=Trema orientale TaxID=63057 RepID=A0A2P5EAM2_TREOI|nr:Endonuclease/exonuclease/phosphatase [Trema orientale]
MRVGAEFQIWGFMRWRSMAIVSFPKTVLLLLQYRTVTVLLNPRSISSARSVQMAWACKRCTFLNPPSQQSACQICLSSLSSSSSPSPSASSSSIPKWSCKACTFLNPYNKPSCQVCDTRAPVSSLSSFEDLNDTGPDSELDPSIGSVFFPLQPCKRLKSSDTVRVDPDSARLSGFQAAKASDKAITVSEDAGSGTGLNTLKILSYNVWFREDLELQKRMKALGDLIELHSPEILCFQEVTPNIYNIFQQSSWWSVYKCSVSKQMAFSMPYFCMQLSKLPVKSFSCRPFGNSAMGRELCVAEIEVHKDKPLVVATSHLESPCPAPPKWDQMFSKERVEQATEAINFLQKNHNVVFAGDMNWDDKLDGQFPLPDGWFDAWAKLRPEENGWTYDTKSNQMLSGNRSLQKRLDRFVCKLHDFKIQQIEMIGKDAIPGLSYIKEKKVKKEIKKLELPVLPSDHYGLLLTICNL